jgi:hypothetical protein
MIDHIIALKSLALRSPETVDYWTGLARETVSAAGAGNSRPRPSIYLRPSPRSMCSGS